jgi:tetratricopeptide (TPR) repeat protein
VKKPWVPVAAVCAIVLALAGGWIRQWYEQSKVVSLIVLPYEGSEELRKRLATVPNVRVLGPVSSAAVAADLGIAEKLAAQYLVNRDGAVKVGGSAKVWDGTGGAEGLLAAVRFKLDRPVGSTGSSAESRKALEGVAALDRLEGNPTELLRAIQAAANRALGAGEPQPEAHLAKGVTLMLLDRNWEEAEKEIRMSLQQRPADAMALRWYAHHQQATGKAGDAVDTLRRALALEPLDPATAIALGLAYVLDKQYSIAEEHLKQCEVFFPNHPATQMVRALLLRAQSDFNGTVQALQVMLDRPDSQHLALPLAAEALARAGRKEEASAVLAKAGANAPTDLVGWARVALGEADAGYQFLARGADEHSLTLLALHASTLSEGMQKDARYAEVAGRLRLTKK